MKTQKMNRIGVYDETLDYKFAYPFYHESKYL